MERRAEGLVTADDITVADVAATIARAADLATGQPLDHVVRSCTIVVLSGHWHFEMDDGSGFDLGPGDLYAIPPGHDAWVVGDEPVRTIDWAPAQDHATQGAIDAATSG